MSTALIDLAKKLIDSSISGKNFTSAFFKQWRLEGNSGILSEDDEHLGNCLRLMFGLADSFVDDHKDSPEELTELELRQELTKLLKHYGYL